jgi:hypothetical protein
MAQRLKNGPSRSARRPLRCSIAMWRCAASCGRGRRSTPPSTPPSTAGRTRRPFFRFPVFAWPNAAGLAAAALVGFLVGWSGLDADYASQNDSVDRQIFASVVEDATW